MTVASARNQTLAVAIENEPVIRTTRLIGARRDLVFRAWTQPEMFARWFGPNGYSVTLQEMDVCVGGLIRFIMHGPDGTDYSNRMLIREIAPGEKLAYLHGRDMDNDPNAFEVVVMFDDEHGATRIRMQSTFPSIEARNAVAKFGAIELGAQTLEKLVAAVGGAPARPTPSFAPLRIVRTFPAPLERVFAMFTQAEHFAKWWGPHGFDCPMCQIDARPGGFIRIDMRSIDTGEIHTVDGEVVAIEPPSRFVMRLRVFGDENGPGVENFTSLSFVGKGGETEVAMEVEVPRARPDMHFALSGMEQGWSESLDKLVQHLA